MSAAVLFPEAVLCRAWDQWWSTRSLRTEVNRITQRAKGRNVRSNFVAFRDDQCEWCAYVATSRSENESQPGLDRSVKLSSQILEGVDNVVATTWTSGDCEDPTANKVVVTDTARPNPPWTVEQAYFAATGGLAVDTSSFWDKPRLTFTPEGIIMLAEMNLLPRFSQADVEVRSNANSITKLFVCMQVLWYFIQSIARLTQGLPLSIIEVHTLTHIGCAIVMYTIWFRKPYNVTSPIISNSQPLVNMAALLALRYDHEDSGWGALYDEYINDDDDEWKIYRREHTASNTSEAEEVLIYGNPHEYPEFPAEPTGYTQQCSTRNTISIQTIRRFNKAPANSPKIFAHLEAANNALDYLKQHDLHFRWEISKDGWTNYYPSHAFLDITDTVKGRWNGNSHYKPPPHIRRNAAILFSGIYGASHLSAWSFHFPTTAEMWLWRACCITMATTPILVAVFWLCRKADGLLRRVDEKSAPRKERVWWLRRWCGLFLVGVVGWTGFYLALALGSYPYIRLFILGEALASLRSPEEGTYKDVDWTKFIPHAF